MASTIKKYLSLDRLQEYDALLKQEIVDGNDTVLTSAKSHSNDNLATAKTYTDNAVAQKSQVQIITWGEND